MHKIVSPADRIPEGPLKLAAILVSAYVVAVSGYLWTAHLQRPWPYVLAIGVVALAWLAHYVLDARNADGPAPRVTSRKLLRAIIVAGLMLAVPLTKALWPG
jgi:hypothetical protein